MFLLGIMKDLVARGWKSDKDFRAEYLLKVEEAMRTEFPNTDLRTNPHILSKLHTWKKSYGLLSQILGASGVGFNLHGDYKLDVEDEQWSQIVKNGPSLRFMRHKSWPYYDAWKILFGKDRATGVGSEGLLEMARNTTPLPRGPNTRGGIEYHTDDGGFTDTGMFTEHVSPEAPVDSGFSSARETLRASTASKKRKTWDALDGLIDVIGRMHAETNTRLELLATRIGYEFDLTKARKEVFELVGVTPGLSLAQVFDSSEYVLNKVKRLDYFMNLPEVARQAYVWRSLEKMSTT